jgi:hypothetical protein
MRREQPLRSTDIAAILEDFLADRLGKWDWDDFISVPLKDPGLDRVRARCASLPEEFPPEHPEHYCNADGFEAIRDMAEALRRIE